MNTRIYEIFKEEKIVNKIKNKLPYLFQLVEIENSRDGKLGMEIGSAREKIIIALLMYKFGKDNVNANIPITTKEIDVILFNNPISIKTVTNKNTIGIKLIWTVDSKKVLDFIENYNPFCDILFVQINWNSKGGFFLLSKESQKEILKKYGKSFYFKLPKQGTNPRGVEMSTSAIKKIIEHPTTKKISIFWDRNIFIKTDTYNRWIDYWSDQ